LRSSIRHRRAIQDKDRARQTIENCLSIQAITKSDEEYRIVTSEVKITSFREPIVNSEEPKLRVTRVGIQVPEEQLRVESDQNRNPGAKRATRD
jgi:hypothetical protein